MSAAARPQDPSNEKIRVALAELRTFEDLTKNPSTTSTNKIEMEMKANKVYKELRSAFASDKKIRNDTRDSLTAFIGAVHAYLEFKEAAPPPRGLSPASARQRATSHSNMWSDMRKALNKLLDKLEELS